MQTVYSGFLTMCCTAETPSGASAGNDRPALMRQVTHNVKRRIMVGKLFGGACKYRDRR